jgi:hypothetical protein
METLAGLVMGLQVAHLILVFMLLPLVIVAGADMMARMPAMTGPEELAV